MVLGVQCSIKHVLEGHGSGCYGGLHLPANGPTRSGAGAVSVSTCVEGTNPAAGNDLPTPPASASAAPPADTSDVVSINNSECGKWLTWSSDCSVK